VIGFAMYALTLLGVTIGFHRYLTHRAFQTSKAVEYILAIVGSMAIEGPVVNWVADHRKHHAHTDEEGDPHSPHGFGPGLRGTIKGLFHAHVGWLWEDHGIAERRKYARDLVEDRGMRIINLSFGPLAALSLAIPFFAGWAIGGSLRDGLTAFLWGGLVRVFFLHHVTWSINSICHFFGRRRFATTDQSTNVFWLALPSFGEAWHHNHHAFPRSAFHGLRWYQVDVAGLVILALEKLGLVWNVVRISPERQAQRISVEST
jgi:stearoyl-CoA desaturase (Delta-9 desaturase)